MCSSAMYSIVLGVMVMQVQLATLKVTTDNVVIDRSCRLVIPPKTIISDADNDGVIHVASDDITIEFADGSVLRGSPAATRPDEYRGYGIQIAGHKNVTIRNAHISGFWCAVRASDASGLTLENIDASDNRRAYLKSTPTAEDGGDWLFPHQNDDHEWLNNYGAAIYIERSEGVTVRDCKIRHGQNALLLDRVDDSKIYDNDFSFNSGWGMGLWRCTNNVISRNAIDFCVRGYSHGVYNRGQDSAGILMFEQNVGNVLAENSVTHGGDGFFGFAGREALGEGDAHPVEWYTRRGNRDNLLISNDFSYAPAHGIEMTFSFGNKFIGNRMVDNAICGVWGGYSQDTLIAGNTFQENGSMGYGLERGGINIEHGKNNRIVHNVFRGNKCGVHLWWDPDPGFADKPWAKANGVESRDNLITANEFHGDKVAFHFRGKSSVTLGENKMDGVEKEMLSDANAVVNRKPDLAFDFEPPKYTVFGKTRPVGARKQLRGRENIIMTEWGPWDHESPLIRKVRDVGDAVSYEFLNMGTKPDVKMVEGTNISAAMELSDSPGGAPRYTLEATQPGVHPYVVQVRAGAREVTCRGTLLATKWKATFFKWSKDVDPREDIAGWRKLADQPDAITVETGRLQFKYGFGGPSEMKLSKPLTAAKLGGDHFGMIARTRLPLSAGKWKFSTQSDDGVRVIVDGKPVIDNWTWHGPTKNDGTLELPGDKTVEIVVEHFEIDGFAVLELRISRE